MIKTIPFIALMICALHLHAQESSPTIWSVSQATDLRTGFSIDYHGSFTVHGDSVLWKQKNVAADYFFRIIGKSGTPDDLKANGKMILDVEFRGRAGTMEFSGQDENRQLRIRMESGDRDLLPYVFRVSSVEKI